MHFCAPAYSSASSLLCWRNRRGMGGEEGCFKSHWGFLRYRAARHRVSQGGEEKSNLQSENLLCTFLKRDLWFWLSINAYLSVHPGHSLICPAAAFQLASIVLCLYWALNLGLVPSEMHRHAASSKVKSVTFGQNWNLEISERVWSWGTPTQILFICTDTPGLSTLAPSLSGWEEP